MSAVIATRPVLRPTYNNAALSCFGNWYSSNEPALAQYWRDLGGDPADADGFFDFCATQYDVQLMANPQPVRARHVEDDRDAAEFFEAEQCPSDRHFGR